MSIVIINDFGVADMTIDEMKKVKEERGYSFDVLSAYSGVPRATLVRIFDGTTTHPRRVTLDAIERVLGGDEHQFPGKRFHFGLSEVFPDYNVLFDPKLTPVFRVAEEAANPYGRQKHGLTASDYLEMHTDKRTELIEGDILVMEDPLLIHSEITQYIFTRFSDYIREHNGSCKPVVSGTNVILKNDKGDDSVVCPDFFVVCDKKKLVRKGVLGGPDFVLEVTSPSNCRNDYIRKLSIYANAGVREYWILDPQKRQLIKYLFKIDEPATFLPLEGTTGVAIYNDDLQIDLAEISRMIDEDQMRDE